MTETHGFYTTDHLGSVREMTDSTGTVRARYSYDPYGRISKVSGDLEADFGFTGFYRHQASGLNLTMYRAYDPELGRWLSRDPIEEEGGLNLYGYAKNAPSILTDSWGLFIDLILEPPPLVPRPFIPPEMIQETIRLNGGRNRVSLPDGRDVDLAGKGHFDKMTGEKVETPHTHDPQPPFDAPYQNIPRPSNPTPRPSTIQDIKDAIQHLGGKINNWFWGTSCRESDSRNFPRYDT